MGYVFALAAALELQATTVEGIGADDLAAASRCEGWSIRDVLEHSIGVTREFTGFAQGLTDEPHAAEVDLLGRDHGAVARGAVVASALAWRRADMSRLCRLSFGTFSAEAAAGINLFDALAHTWDVAAPLGLELPAHSDLWSLGLEAARGVIGSQRDVSQYGPEVHAEASAAPMTRFLAFLGRGGSL